MSSGEGLGEVWGATQDVFEEIIPVYERGNRIISFGLDLRYRREGIVGVVRREDLVLDLGCGPGTMSRVLLNSVGEVKGLVLADASQAMLEAAKPRVPTGLSTFVNGVFENLPFRGGVFDVVMCGFSFRDARSYVAAVEEVRRVLKRGRGRFLIVDLGKPDNRILRWLVGLYFRFIAGFLASLFLGRRGFIFSKIYPTYRKYLRISQIRRILEERFEHVHIETKLLGGALIAVAEKPRPSP